jgi:hypothetical protein
VAWPEEITLDDADNGLDHSLLRKEEGRQETLLQEAVKMQSKNKP